MLEQSCSEVSTWVVSGKGIAWHHTCSAWALPFPQMASIFRWGFWVLVSVSLLTQKETIYFLLKLVFWVTLLLKNGDLLEVQVPLLQCSGWIGQQHVVASVCSNYTVHFYWRTSATTSVSPSSALLPPCKVVLPSSHTMEIQAFTTPFAHLSGTATLDCCEAVPVPVSSWWPRCCDQPAFQALFLLQETLS